MTAPHRFLRDQRADWVAREARAAFWTAVSAYGDAGDLPPDAAAAFDASSDAAVRAWLDLNAPTSVSEYFYEVAAYAEAYPSQRDGQAHFNVLAEVRPDLSDAVRGVEDLDPFHNDVNLARFRVWLVENWDA